MRTAAKFGFLASLAGWLATPALAQSNLGTITFTNKTGTLITNARVVEVRPDGLVYLFSGGGGTVSFADLPPEVRQRYGYDPQKAARAAQAEQQQQTALAARQLAEQQAQAWRGPPKKAHVLKVIPDGGAYPEYLVQVEGRPRQVIVPDLPARVRSYFDELDRLEAALRQATNQLARARASVPAPLPGRSRAARIRNLQVTQAKKRVSADQKQVSQAKAALARLQKQEQARTAVTLCQTARKYGGAEIWIWAGR